MTEANKPRRWRELVEIHPAAELFPLMGEGELRELADDIEKHGLRERVVLWDDPEGTSWLLDGRNRLDALELLDEQIEPPYSISATWEWLSCPGRNFDPYNYVLSRNVHRRHLTAEQKRDLIAKVLKAKPEASDREIGKQTKTDGKTVAVVRTELERRAEIPHVEKRTDSKGRKQPARKQAKPPGAPSGTPPPDDLEIPDFLRRAEVIEAEAIEKTPPMIEPEVIEPDIEEEGENYLLTPSELGLGLMYILEVAGKYSADEVGNGIVAEFNDAPGGAAAAELPTIEQLESAATFLMQIAEAMKRQKAAS